jgi:hypothetical protein
MSELVQRRERARAEARRQRERNARKRAERSRELGDTMSARIHELTAELQADAAAESEMILEEDRRLEGDQLQE